MNCHGIVYAKADSGLDGTMQPVISFQFTIPTIRAYTDSRIEPSGLICKALLVHMVMTTS